MNDATNHAIPTALEHHSAALSAALRLWETRDEPQAPVKVHRAASDAISHIDAVFAELHAMRTRLLSENRRHQDAHNARVDAMLARLAAEREQADGQK